MLGHSFNISVKMGVLIRRGALFKLAWQQDKNLRTDNLMHKLRGTLKAHGDIEITGSNIKEHNLLSCPDCTVVKTCKVINNIQHELTNMKCTYCTKEDLH